MVEPAKVMSTLAMIFVLAILFTPQNSDAWQSLLFLGFVCGLGWFWKA